MYLKWNEIITAGSFIIAVMTRKKAKQKLISRASWAVFALSGVVLVYNFLHPDKSRSEGGQIAETKGNNSPAINVNATTGGSNPPAYQNVQGVQSVAQSGGITAQNVYQSSTVNYIYVAPTSTEAKSAFSTLREKLDSFRAGLLEKYPFGCTLIGLHGEIFTAYNLEDTNAIFRVDGSNVTLTVNRQLNEAQLYYTISILRPIQADVAFPGSSPGLRIFGSFGPDAKLSFSLTATKPVDNEFAISGIGHSVEVVDPNPDSPIIAIGFKAKP